MTTYQLTGEGYVIKAGDTKVPILDVPGYEPHHETLAYRAWLAAGGVPLPVPPEPPCVPPVVSMRQARLALLGAGLYAGVNAAIDSLPNPQKEAARIEWEYAMDVQRSSGLVPMMCAALGLSEARLDSLFITAATL